jgi:hypothetical protein
MVMQMDRFDWLWLKTWLFLRWIPTTYHTVLGELRPRQLELIGALWAISWGVWVGNPWWDVFPSSTTFRFLGIVAPEWVWGLAMIGVGAAALVALYLGRLIWRYWVSVTAFLLWGFILLLFILSNFLSTATITYGMMVGMAGLAVGKLKERINLGGQE